MLVLATLRYISPNLTVSIRKNVPHCGSIYVRDGLVDTLLTMSIFSLFSSEARRLVGRSCHDSIARGLDGLKKILELYSYT